MTTDRRYIGQINPDQSRTLWRVDADGGTCLVKFHWKPKLAP